MSRLIPLVLILLGVFGPMVPVRAEFNGYEGLSDWQRLCTYQRGMSAGLASSYKRIGGNMDFNHYEWPEGFQTEDLDPVTVATIEGPGVITRFWMPHADANSAFKVRMFFDGETVPRIDTDSNQLLDGNYGYVQSPLVSTLIGGQVSYEPIVFAESLRIESNNLAYPGGSDERNYYQYSYYKLPAGTAVISYDGTLTAEQQSDRDCAVQMLNNVGENPAGTSAQAIVVSTEAAGIAPGQALSLADLSGGGQVRRLNVKMAEASDAELDGLRLRARYDGLSNYAIDVPVSHFFGAGHERAPYQSLPLGTDSPEGFYSYWPMPYHKSVVIELYNSSEAGIDIDSAVVEYEAGQAPADALYLHARHNEERTMSGQEYHLMLDVEGAGHYVGNLLYVQHDAGDRYVLEADDVITADGTLLHGTGLEDTYNGGFYYNHVAVQTGDGDLPYPEFGIGPFHGLLHMDDGYFGDEFFRADQYRWVIGDSVPFSESIEVKVENILREADILFGSTVFYYLKPDLPGDADGNGFVDGNDLSIILTNWGRPDMTRQDGDLSGDSFVGGDDYSEVVTYWGTGTPAETTSIPEPATLGLMLVAGLAILRGKRPI